MSTFGERLRKARKKKGMTQKELGTIMGIRSLSQLSFWEMDRRVPDAATCVALCQALDIGLDYLLDCYHGPEPFTEEQRQIARTYGQLDQHGRDMVAAVAKIELGRVLSEQQKGSGKVVRMPERRQGIYLPCAGQAASAGTGIMLGPEEAMEQVLVEDNETSQTADFLVTVSGDSMEPAFQEGDLLLVKKTEELALGEFGLFSLNGDGFVKRLGDGRLESLNPAYGPLLLDENSSLHVFGRILGTAQRLEER